MTKLTLSQLSSLLFRDLGDLVSKGVFEKVGKTGRGAHYVLARKPDTNPTNQT